MAGTITVGELLSDPTSNNKITVGSGTTLDLVNGAGSVTLPALGKVLQVVSFLTSVQGSQTLVSTADNVINSISKAITPKGANSKFLVQVRWFGECNWQWNLVFNIQMDNVRVNVGNNNFNPLSGLCMPTLTYYTSDNSSTPEMLNFSTLVSTSSVVGTAITFKLVGAISFTNTAILWNNRTFTAPSSEHEFGSSEIIITEIGG
jgi:hypothetical protein